LPSARGGDPYDLSSVTLREIAELETVGVEGMRVTREALALLRETGTSPGELAARYLKDCVRVGSISLIGYQVAPDQELRSGAVHVVLDPATRRITIYEEFL